MATLFAASKATAVQLPETPYLPTFFEKLYQSIPGKPASALVDLRLRFASRHVVRVITDGGKDGGAGILVGDGWVLTANHVFGATLPIQVANSLVVTDFDVEYPTAERNYFVFAPESGFYTSNDSDGNYHLDYTLCRVKPADPRRLTSLIAGHLHAASLPDVENACWQSVIVGHPDTECEAVGHEWAYRAAKPCLVRRSRIADWELVSHTLICNGYSGGALVGTDGSLLGMMSGQNHAISDRKPGCIVSAHAIVADVARRFARLKLEVPPGLRAARATNITASTDFRPYPKPFHYSPSGDIETNLESSGEIAGEQTTLSQVLPTISQSRIAEIESCIGYINTLLPTSEKARICPGIQGTCFRIGHDWVLTAKHVIECPARAERAWITFRFGRDEDFAQFYGNPPDAHIRFCPQDYYSSDDRTFSYNGKSAVLDYALMRIIWPSQGSLIRNELEKTQYLRVLPSGPEIGQSVLIPQHRNKEPRAWFGPNKLPESPLVQSVDSRRVYHAGATQPGASGAPLLVANLAGSDLAVIGLHTHARFPKCDISPERRDKDVCYGSDQYWTRNREAAEQEHSFGANIYAIMQDLMLRHRFDLNRVEGFRDALPNFGARYGGGSA